MNKAEDIRDEDSLRAWLVTQPREVSVLIASRAALRVMPLWADYCLFDDGRTRDVTPVPVLWANLASVVAAISPTDEMNATADRAAEYASGFIDLYPVDFSASIASNAVASASAASASSSRIDAFIAAIDAVAAVCNATTADADAFWLAVRADVRAIEAGADVASTPLWPGKGPEANPLSDLWHKVASKGFTPGSPYDFWRRWYETHLDPARHPPMPFDMLKDIALIDSKIWECTPEDLAAEIARIEARYGAARKAVEASDMSREAGGGPELADESGSDSAGRAAPAQVQKVKVALGENRRTLPPTIDAVQQFILLEIKRWQTSNELNAKVPDECKRQVENYVAMYDALEGIRAQIPATGDPTDENAEEVISLGRLYLEKYKTIPREKSTHIVEGTMVFATAALTWGLGLGPMAGAAIGALTFARPDANTILSAAKEFTRSETSGA
ncbi:MAG: hypothetical protein CSA70_00860 [Rhodobacterales bacterium]|nr:MAG: hypothetical protein CSA70_00860 [Rhodobacterales bacterium]